MIKKKHFLRIFLVCLALTGAAMLLHSAVLSSRQEDAACKEAIDDCKTQETNGKMIWEGLSQQFVSVI